MAINDDLLYQHIGEQIKRIRQESNMSQEELANKVGVTRTSITNIERGFQKLPLHLLYNICEVLNVEAISFLPSINDVAGNIKFDSQRKEIPPEISPFIESALKKLDKNNDN